MINVAARAYWNLLFAERIILPMAALDRWTEVLRCPFCTLTGVASLSLGTPDDLAIVVDDLPSGFKVVSSKYGDTFFCEACNRAAVATTK
jgi:hypothetical protein